MTKETSHARDGRTYTISTKSWIGYREAAILTWAMNKLAKWKVYESPYPIEKVFHDIASVIDVMEKKFTLVSELTVESLWWAPDEAKIKDKRVASLDVYITTEVTPHNQLAKIYM